MSKINEEVKKYNELQEKWWALKHANIMHMYGAKGYEHVDMAENYERMQEIEQELDEIEV